MLTRAQHRKYKLGQALTHNIFPQWLLREFEVKGGGKRQVGALMPNTCLFLLSVICSDLIFHTVISITNTLLELFNLYKPVLSNGCFGGLGIW